MHVFLKFPHCRPLNSYRGRRFWIGSLAIFDWAADDCGARFAMQVDDLVNQQQVVMKNMESNYRKVGGMLGAAILGDGRVAHILDVAFERETWPKT